jgi:large conductance mechanosensitive channel
MLNEFRDFLLKTNALALAVGVVLGAAIGGVVNSLVNDILMPPVGYVLGGVDFASMKIVLKAAAAGADPKTEVAIRYGSLINAIISFIIIAFVVYMISLWFIRTEEAAPTKQCPFCKEANIVDASKCRFCASVI